MPVSIRAAALDQTLTSSENSKFPTYHDPFFASSTSHPLDSKRKKTREMGILYDNTDNTFIVTIGGYKIKTTVTASYITASNWIDEVLRFTGQWRKPVTVGLDIVWCPHKWHGTSGQNPVALLQLCVGSRCLLFQLLHCGRIPDNLHQFFLDNRYRFVGVDVKKDLEKLEEQFGLIAGSCWNDLRKLAEEKTGRSDLKQADLKTLLEEFVGLYLGKSFWTRTSDWGTQVLDLEQIEYAAFDAFASCQVGHRLVSIGSVWIVGRKKKKEEEEKKL
ncbi:hypothetical protein LUZ62_038883 [Rhynchospora pubera]|uniref:3'-5' exonuclease domain-containing protein n=1 Tax=Rhynchospora pubera TaxID=906938 RepID=A0AAV8FBR6_9POAL|nr:hypothetical protein LUZ62_038883 [Rhynchospora pubera]